MAKPLVIVESESEGQDHRGLPRSRPLHGDGERRAHPRPARSGAKQAPKNVTKPEVRRLGIDVDDHFRPIYVVPDNKKHVVAELKAALKDASELYLATDEDREGEAISWHLLEVLKPTRAGQAHGVPRDHQRGDRRGHRQLARPRHEAGRGAGGSPHPRPARRLRGVERRVPPHRPRHVGRTRAERRDAPRRRPRTRPHGVPQRHRTGTSRARSRASDAGVPRARSSRSTASASRRDATSTPTPARSPPTPTSRSSTRTAPSRSPTRLDDQPFTRRVGRDADRAPSARRRRSSRRRCSRRRRASSASAPARTMHVAQGLYERGLITYMRTDSTSLSDAGGRARPATRSAACTATTTSPTSRATYRSKVKNAQEAHEAIRPAGDRMRTADDLQPRAAGQRRASPLRPHLEAHGRVADGRRPHPARHAPPRGDVDRGRGRRVPGDAAAPSSSPVTSAPTSRAPTTPTPSSKTARRSCPPLDEGDDGRLRASCARRVTPRNRRRATPRRAW